MLPLFPVLFKQITHEIANPTPIATTFLPIISNGPSIIIPPISNKIKNVTELKTELRTLPFLLILLLDIPPARTDAVSNMGIATFALPSSILPLYIISIIINAPAAHVQMEINTLRK